MTTAGAMAGMIAPLVFVILVIVQGLQHSDYSHIELPISALAAWPHGWVQSLNFVVLGSGVLAFTAALHRRLGGDRGRVAGTLLLAAAGIGLLLAAMFPWERIDGGFFVPRGHLAGAAFTFIGAGTGLVVISRRMAVDAHWRSMSAYTLASGIAVLALFLITMFAARPEDAPLHTSLGLLQRLTLLVWFPCMAVLSWHIIRTRPTAMENATAARSTATVYSQAHSSGKAKS